MNLVSYRNLVCNNNGKGSRIYHFLWGGRNTLRRKMESRKIYVNNGRFSGICATMKRRTLRNMKTVTQFTTR